MGVEELCKPMQGDFLAMPFKDDTFDAAYAIEATCHAAKVSQGDMTIPSASHSVYCTLADLMPCYALSTSHVSSPLPPV